MDTPNHNNLAPEMSVQYVKGVGPARAKAFAELGIQTLSDLLEYFPRDWVFMPEPVKIKHLQPDIAATVIGLVEQTDFLGFRRPPMFKAVLSDETAACNIVWFHGAFLKNKLDPA